MNSFRDISIKKKIVAIIMLIVITAVVPVSVMFTFYQLGDFKKHTKENVRGIAKIMAANSVAASVFNDSDGAMSNLKLLDTQKHIIFACIKRTDGSILARYEKNPSNLNPTSIEKIFSNADGDVILLNKLIHVRDDIIFDSEKVGSIYITADLSDYYDETLFNLLLQIGAFMALFFVSYLLASYFQRIITQPVINLLGLTRKVAESRNYGLRAEKHGNDETGDLIDGFNDMLKEIETKDRELISYADGLEVLVSERTIELNRKNSKLRKAVGALKVAKDQAVAGSIAKSRFLANMSHELRTPLNHIIGFTELVHDGQLGRLNESQKEYLGDVLESSRHLLTLINDILDLSKIEAGKMELSLSSVLLSDFLEEAAGIIRDRCMAKGVDVAVICRDQELAVRADIVKLRQIIYNLLGNALKFTPEGGRITILSQAIKNGTFASISVSDTGIGIKKEDLQRIFSPFEQADDTISRNYQGTGLGLSLTRKLVELHDGKIWAESKGENKGSCFHVVLPLNSM
ncbi:ATP-binding protein [Desulforegula conservatrix]|uniref:ATP-binding protein n=1 Tax=Desulforegula conservatrix TaxID=153026 RepID=UPI00042375B5|nr:ATP-binding protein [Desulforegula conservatrix]